MNLLRRLPGVFALVVAGWLVARSSGLNVGWHGADAAQLRLSWIARPERIDECRTLTEAELATRPAHMRQAQECSGSAATYRLRVSVDDSLLADHVLTGGGLRRDRSIFVLDEYRLTPGARRIQLQFDRVEPWDAPMDSANVGRGAVPRSLVLDTTLTITASRVALVSLADRQLALTTP